MLTGRANPSSASCQPLASHLIEEISHRVINEYGEAIAILSLAASVGEAAPALRRAADRLLTMAEAHQSLLVPITEEYIDLGDHVGKLCHSLSRASLDERSIQLTVATDEIRLDAARCWRVGLIVSELVRNAARHGLGDSHGSIRVSLNRSGNSVWCVVCDDGCAAYHRPEEGGRRLVRALTAEIGGSAQWKFTPRGSVAGVCFPLITS
ncbi:sensor histidine kinase [Mesorhizobium opportunistum]|uniref:histidine kinase n=1 Tax=Mesorhizobium opportunistum TaxID=593909 RepID=A0ABV1YPT7_9HYPH